MQKEDKMSDEIAMSKHSMFVFKLVKYFPVLTFLGVVADVFLSVYYAGSKGYVFSSTTNELFDIVAVINKKKTSVADVLVEMGFLIKRGRTYFLTDTGEEMVKMCFEEKNDTAPLFS